MFRFGSMLMDCNIEIESFIMMHYSNDSTSSYCVLHVKVSNYTYTLKFISSTSNLSSTLASKVI